MSTEPDGPGLFDEALKGEFVTERLATDLKQQIESGVLRPGTLIRPVRELMKQYRISYNSVRKALGQLADAGYLALEQGRGTFVKGAKVPRGVDAEHIENKVSSDSNENCVKSAEKVDVSTVRSGPDTLVDDVATIEAPSEKISEAEAVDSRESIVNQSSPSLPSVLDLPCTLSVWVSDELLAGALPEMGQALQAFQLGALNSGWRLAIIPAGTGRVKTPDTGGRACVIWGMVDPARLESVVRPGQACVVVGYAPPRLDVSAVMPENFAGAYELTRRMVLQGHREVAFLHAARRSPGSDAAERLAGCRVALEEAGVVLPDHAVLECAAHAEWLADRLLALKPRPTAVLVSEQALAEHLIRQLKERGVGVPRALSVACFGSMGDPNPLDITSACVDWRRVGTRVVYRLRELLSGAPNERMRISLPVEIHEGVTVGRA